MAGFAMHSRRIGGDLGCDGRGLWLLCFAYVKSQHVSSNTVVRNSRRWHHPDDGPDQRVMFR